MSNDAEYLRPPLICAPQTLHLGRRPYRCEPAANPKSGSLYYSGTEQERGGFFVWRLTLST